MKTSIAALPQRYAAALRHYLAQPDETGLQRAYELGREAVAGDLALMDLAKLHSEALATLLTESPSSAALRNTCRQAGAFYQESLWAFEMMQRGFWETNRLLREANEALKERSRLLETANRALQAEMVERQRIEAALRKSQEELRLLSDQILCAQEEERKRISRELHDEVGQALTALNLSLAMLKRSAPPRLTAQLGELEKFVEQTMERIHAFTRELRPAMLDHLGLIPALQAYVRNFGKRTGLRIRLAAVPEVEQLGIEEKTVLYRVMQEGLTNIVKHAAASRAAVVIRRSRSLIRMEVQDNGKAFRVEENLAPGARKRLGLLGIQERVRLVNGQFSLQSIPGKGTRIRVQIPMKIGGAKLN